MLLVLFGLVTQTAAQDVKVNSIQEQKHYYVDASKPSVYLCREQDNAPSHLHLRLSNNTRWAIMLRIDRLLSLSDAHDLMLQDGRIVSGLTDSIKILPEYFIESPLIENGLIAHRWCTSQEVWIPSGQSVLFRVPREELPRLAIIYLRFHYEWETSGHEPEHRLNFRWFDPSLSR
jgi:hypothetical protein